MISRQWSEVVEEQRSIDWTKQAEWVTPEELWIESNTIISNALPTGGESEVKRFTEDTNRGKWKLKGRNLNNHPKLEERVRCFSIWIGFL